MTRAGLVLGDPAGVGAELAAKLLQSLPPQERASTLVIGDARQLEAGARIAKVRLPEVEVLDRANADPAAIPLGKACAAGGKAALDNFAAALDLARAGKLDAVCFTPFNKQALMLAGNRFEDELRYAADHLGWNKPVGEFNILGRLWNARVTSHIALSQVSAHLTREHGIEASGPFPADTVYLRARDGQFDSVVTMYHDQGQIAIKLLGFSRGVTLLGGLPMPVTTPAQGTAYDIAGKGVATADALKNAFALARALGSA
jgi:4-hydroxythreonine-4-phosphate dehydrogenase